MSVNFRQFTKDWGALIALLGAIAAGAGAYGSLNTKVTVIGEKVDQIGKDVREARIALMVIKSCFNLIDEKINNQIIPTIYDSLKYSRERIGPLQLPSINISMDDLSNEYIASSKIEEPKELCELINIYSIENIDIGKTKPQWIEDYEDYNELTSDNFFGIGVYACVEPITYSIETSISNAVQDVWRNAFLNTTDDIIEYNSDEDMCTITRRDKSFHIKDLIDKLEKPKIKGVHIDVGSNKTLSLSVLNKDEAKKTVLRMVKDLAIKDEADKTVSRMVKDLSIKAQRNE